MRTLSDRLLKQAEKLVEEKKNKNVELSYNEKKAIQRINRISKSLNTINVEENYDLLGRNDFKDIRLGLCDGNLELYQELYQRTQSKLEKISPESLRGYVALLG